MPHVRQQIRHTVCETLKIGAPLAQHRVLATRTRGMAADKLPCLLVYMTNEASEAAGGRRPNVTLGRRCDLIVAGVAVGETAGDNPDGMAKLEDRLDAMAAEIEAALAADPKIGGLAKDLELRSTTMSVLNSVDPPGGEVVLTYRITYETRETDPTVAV
jgi:hypothetical protein